MRRLTFSSRDASSTLYVPTMFTWNAACGDTSLAGGNMAPD